MYFKNLRLSFKIITQSEEEGGFMPHRDIRPNVTVTIGGNPANRAGSAVWIKFVLAVALPVVLASMLISITASGAEAAVTCNKYASINGSDKARGTSSAPFRTAQRLADSLAAGQAGCLRGGTYTERDGSVTIKKSNITLRRAPGSSSQPSIEARVLVSEGAGGVTISGLRLEGAAGFVNVLIRGNRARLIGNNITNGHRRNSCVLVGSEDADSATGTSISGNRIHNCGYLPRTNQNHGIYVSAGQNTRILNNLIYDNADRGVQLYPNADGTLIQGNTIKGNGQGMTFGGVGRSVSSNNTVVGNAIINSRAGWNVTANWNQTSLVGTGNIVRNNCLWALNRTLRYGERGGINTGAGGFKAFDNRISAQCA